MVQQRPDRTLGPKPDGNWHDEFWYWCGQGELRLQRCECCGAISWPVANACEYCSCASLVWERMSGRGTIFSWCTFEQDYYHAVLPLPWETILVELHEGPLFISNPKGFSLNDVEVGMAVKLAFIACEDGSGRFSLPVFDLG